jgi:hypothetical protein
MRSWRAWIYAHASRGAWWRSRRSSPVQTEDDSVMLGNSRGDEKHFEGADEGLACIGLCPQQLGCMHGWCSRRPSPAQAEDDSVMLDNSRGD